MLRLLPSGRVGSLFSNTVPGYGASVGTGTGHGAVADLTVLADGRVVVVGSDGRASSSLSYPFVQRLLSTGQPDASFGPDGLAHIDPAFVGHARRCC